MSHSPSPTQLPLQFEFGASQTFDQFIPGDNLEVCQQLQALASGECSEPQLIYLSGKAGFGKTHLLQACCQTAQSNDVRMFYLPLGEVAGLSCSILDGLEQLDLVCVDDLQCIAGKQDWEVAFFHFFNRLRDAGHHLVIAAQSSPRELEIQLPDLVSRLQWGVSYRLKPLQDEDKLAALLQRARDSGIQLEARVASYLLAHDSRDLACIWQRLEQLNRASLSQKRKLTVPFLKQFLDDKQ